MPFLQLLPGCFGSQPSKPPRLRWHRIPDSCATCRPKAACTCRASGLDLGGDCQRKNQRNGGNAMGGNHLDVSENSGTPKSSILIGFSNIINHPFWGTPIFGNTHLNHVFFPFFGGWRRQTCFYSWYIRQPISSEIGGVPQQQNAWF